MYEVFKKYISDKAILSDDELERIEAMAIHKKIRKRQYLLQEGDVWNYNAFVCKGCMRTYRVDNNGVEHILKFSVENWWAGDRESYTTGAPAKSNIDALEDTGLLVWTRENFEKLLKDIPAFREFQAGIIAKSFNASQNRIHAVISYSAEEKYNDFIKVYPDIANRVPLHMIASYLGISAETLSRVRSHSAKK